MEPTKKAATAEAVALQEEINLEFAEMTLQQIKTLKARGLADPLTMKEIRKNVAFLNKWKSNETKVEQKIMGKLAKETQRISEKM
ncbi:hypothetical protein [Anaeromusa sp.]|uniref:hypothetical protein n=1 Tax=Anaeromusa sp. TaxID=1872520 RepID=UPI002624E5CD|nr:hypothetical protein [Anaeromusa sp.]MDD3157271.1 hypothetical protein [Anaeromusa sp.]